MIDWSQVAQLRSDVGAEDFDEILDLFFEEVEGITTCLAKATHSTDMGEDLHFLKGSALNLGFSAFSDLCQMGEALCAEGAKTQVNVSEILTVYTASKLAFYDELPGVFPKEDHTNL